MTPEMRKRLEQFLFGLKPKEEDPREEEFKYPWGTFPPGERDDRDRRFIEEYFNYAPQLYKKPKRRKTSRDAEQQMNLRNWRLIHGQQYNPGLLV